MHIHPNSNLQLASLGASRDEIKEIASRRSAEVRRKLSASSNAMTEVEDAASAVVSRTEEQQQMEEQRGPNGYKFGRLLSVRA